MPQLKEPLTDQVKILGHLKQENLDSRADFLDFRKERFAFCFPLALLASGDK